MTDNTRALLEQAHEALDVSRRVVYQDRRPQVDAAFDALSAALAAPATAPAMTEIDYNDDEALRFVQRVLESEAPESDTKAALEMVVSIRTRVLKARASKPATAPTQPSWQDAPTEPGMWACLYTGELSTATFNAYEIEHFDRDEMVGCRWFGPIPEDKQ